MGLCCIESITMNLRNTSFRWIGVIALTATALPTGCSTVREVNSTVQSFHRWAAFLCRPRIAWKPSARPGELPAVVEAQAQQALARMGMTRDDSRPSVVVQISAVARYARDYASWPYYGPWGPRWGWGIGYGRGFGRGFGFGGSMMMDGPPLEYYRAVSVVMRDIKTQQISSMKPRPSARMCGRMTRPSSVSCSMLR